MAQKCRFLARVAFTTQPCPTTQKTLRLTAIVCFLLYRFVSADRPWVVRGQFLHTRILLLALEQRGRGNSYTFFPSIESTAMYITCNVGYSYVYVPQRDPSPAPSQHTCSGQH